MRHIRAPTARPITMCVRYDQHPVAEDSLKHQRLFDRGQYGYLQPPSARKSNDNMGRENHDLSA